MKFADDASDTTSAQVFRMHDELQASVAVSQGGLVLLRETRRVRNRVRGLRL